MPFAVEGIDLSGSDLVLSSSHSAAKGVLTGPDQVHVSYVHSPMRYAWDQQHDYTHSGALKGGLIGGLARVLLTGLRVWDARTANGVDQFAANSQFIARRIQKAYRREAAVIYPPVDVEAFPLQEKKEGFFLVVSRFVPYKKIDLIVEAFRRMPDKELVVIGGGPQEKAVRATAGPNVHFIGWQSPAGLAAWMGRARGLVQAAQEDFGITTVEAQAAGTPVIAYRRGGAAEIVRGPGDRRPTGVFFDQQSVEAIMEGVQGFDRQVANFSPLDCHENALRFNRRRFQREYRALVEASWAAFHGGTLEPVTLGTYKEAVHGRE
jgi:glycosyltransferase involved in cell wall biosynthesis